jgi:hypothetical protein
MKLRTIFIILAVFFIASAGVVYWYLKRPIEIKPIIWGGPNSPKLEVKMPGERWVDTGMWIPANYQLIAVTNNGPFNLAVGNITQQAILAAPPLSFSGIISTFEKPVPSELGLSSSPVAHVVKHEKIYFYSDKPVSIIFELRPLEQDTIDYWNQEIEKYNSKRR